MCWLSIPAAKEKQLDVVVRVTSDCPLIDPFIIDNLIESFLENSCDMSNTAAHHQGLIRRD